MTPPLRQWLAAHRQSLKAAARFGSLPLSATRARRGTAVARWERLAEYRDRLYAGLSEDEKQAADRLRLNPTT